MAQFIVLKQWHDESYSTVKSIDKLLTEVEALAARDMLKRIDPDHEYVIFQVAK